MKLFQHIYKFKSKEQRALCTVSGLGNLPILNCALSLLAFASLLFLPSCINDEVKEPVNTTSPNQKYYISLDVVVPTEATTRSYTDENGESSDLYLAGYKNEIALTSAKLYFCEKKLVSGKETYEVILPLTADQWVETNLPASNPNDKYNKSFKLSAELSENLSELQGLVGKDVYLFIVGNPGTLSNGHNFSKEEEPADDATFSVGSLNAGPIGDFGSGRSGKLMPLVNAEEGLHLTNFKDIQTNNPEEILAKIKELFNTKENDHQVYNMGRIDVERAVARIDFKDKRLDNDWKYTLEKKTLDQGNLTVQLHDLQVFNVNKEAYLFRHTAEGTTEIATKKAKLFGTENDNNDNPKTRYNWIAGSDWNFSEANNSHSKEPQFLNDKSSVLNGSETSKFDGLITISELTKTIKDSSEPIRPCTDGYYPWCYVTENTIPSNKLDPADYATGIAFNFLILDTEGKPLTTDLTDAPKGITESSRKEGDNDNTITITMNDGTWVDVKYTPEVKEGEKVIKNPGYYLTYYGYIVHNDPADYNDEGEELPPMYYGVVRNNVYQLSVKSISNIPTPNQPESYYLSLDIKVLAWVKRDISVKW